MARFLFSALLVLFVAGRHSHAFLYRYHGKHSSSASLATDDMTDKKMAVFFHEEALRVGQSLPFRFPAAVTAPLGFLPRHVADAIPFSTSALPGILAQFGVAKDSVQAGKMEDTLSMCETPGLSWEAKFCATSLEALVEGAQEVLGTTDIREMTSKNVPGSGSPLQEYTIRAVRPIQGSSFMGCHQKEYPYTVYVCHNTGPARAYMVEMEGANGGTVTLVSVCHLDTAEWDADHVAFRLLSTKPGGLPVCHVLPYGHIMWTKKSASLSSA